MDRDGWGRMQAEAYLFGGTRLAAAIIDCIDRSSVSQLKMCVAV